MEESCISREQDKYHGVVGLFTSGKPSRIISCLVSSIHYLATHRGTIATTSYYTGVRIRIGRKCCVTSTERPHDLLTACRIASTLHITSNSCTHLSRPIGIIKLYPTLINHPSLPSTTPQIPFLFPLLSLLSSSSLARPQTGCCSGGVDQEQVTKKF